MKKRKNETFISKLYFQNGIFLHSYQFSLNLSSNNFLNEVKINRMTITDNFLTEKQSFALKKKVNSVVHIKQN